MKNIIYLIIIIILAISLVYGYFFYNPKTFSNADFNISIYQSNIDMDNDGIDDQTDILNNVKEYIETKPKYKSKYYDTGYPSDEYGVCTDVVAFGLLNAGYDLMELVNEDILSNKELYGIEHIDKKIDFRRVRNLKIYFERNAINLTLDISKIDEFQGGDIVVFPKHIGIISDRRNKKGVPYVIHNASPYQLKYEEDILESYDELVGHFRIS